MSWVDVENTVDNVSAKIDDFNDLGQKQGYGEAVWQDVVEPLSGSSTARGALLGTGTAIAADMLDPTPGINPMNIAGGAVGGAVVGAVAPYAVDAVQALSNPYSVVRPETWDKAGEGLGIATGVTGDIRPSVQELNTGSDFTDRGLTIAGNVVDGMNNAYQGALAGTNQLGADVAGFFGFDDVAEMYQVLADNRRASMNNPNSAVGAVAQEATYDAGMGGVLGKGAEALGTVGKGIGRWQQSNVINRGSQYLDELFDTAKGSMYRKDVPIEYDDAGKITDATKKLFQDEFERIDKVTGKLQDKARDVSMFPAAQLATDVIGTVSPKTKNFLVSVWDDVSAYVLGGKKASLREYNKLTSEALDYGVPANEVADLLQYMAYNPKILDPMKEMLLKPGTNTNSAKLLGVGTGITADVED